MQYGNFEYFYEIGASLVLLYLIWIIKYRPYASVFDNLAIIVNQIAILFAFTWFSLKKLLIDTDSIDTIFEKVLIGLIGAVITLSLVRIINGFRNMIAKRVQRTAES